VRAGALAVAVLAAGLLAYFALGRTPAPPPPAPVLAPPAALPAATYTGREACGACHANELKAWQGSHHDLAMQLPDPASVLGDFETAKFEHAGVTSTFFRRDGKYFVRTDGPDGKLADFEIRWTFGAAPLQQYLIELPGGRIQALGIAWDARPRAQGGQRWFHLYPDETLRAGDPLHWTAIQQNWNFMCAECHSTDLRKNFDAKQGHFATTFAEVDVSCEACHGPGSNHVAWARREGDWSALDADKGLAIALDERRDVHWAIAAGTGNAERSRAREGQREVDLCGRCHARASKLSDDYVYGAPLLDTHRVALFEEGLYWSDGQMRDEVYDYGSFLQSRMFAKGVTCGDCHEPHSLQLRQPGSAVCAQCHLPEKYAAPEHHFHPAASAGAECAACHMPTVTYMQIDPRHDHSLRIPRPDLSRRLGTPNACNACHRKQSPEWAAAEIRKRHPDPKPGFQGFAEAFHAGARGEPGARQQLIALLRDPQQPGIVRASAAARLAGQRDPAAIDALSEALGDSDPLVRAAAVEAAVDLEPQLRKRLLSGALGDPVLSVRIAAARALAPLPPEGLSGAQRAALEKGIAEWIRVQEFNADRPESHTNLGALRAERGEAEPALAAFAKALEIDPHFTPAAVNRADLLRALGREAESEASLREAIRRTPQDAVLHHVLGLSLVRQNRREEGLGELGESVRLAPGDARLAYVYGVALHDLGQGREATRVLESALRGSPNDRDLLFALATFLEEAGATERALPAARRLVELEPQDPRARELLARLEASQPGKTGRGPS
jgi:tetratricopeptide (TPR) repeat protein/ssDNA-binding Zn-finger/Zn-ribbon topoisomerase 1